jgi:cytochrome P450
VRINPHELHVSDPDFYDALYTGRRNRYKWSTDMVNASGSIFTTVDYDLHRKRRAPLAPFFSASAIRRFDPVIRSKLDILSSRLGEYRGRGQVVNLDVALTAMTTDIITQYSFGFSYGFLEADDFNPEWRALMMSATELSLTSKQMPRLMQMAMRIPMTWLVWIKPEMASYMRFRAVSASIRANIDAADQDYPGCQ